MIHSSAVSNRWKFEFAIVWDLQQELNAPDKHFQRQLSAAVRRRLANCDHDWRENLKTELINTLKLKKNQGEKNTMY